MSLYPITHAHPARAYYHTQRLTYPTTTHAHACTPSFIHSYLYPQRLSDYIAEELNALSVTTSLDVGAWTNTVRCLPGAGIQFAAYEFLKKALGC